MANPFILPAPGSGGVVSAGPAALSQGIRPADPVPAFSPFQGLAALADAYKARQDRRGIVDALRKKNASELEIAAANANPNAAAQTMLAAEREAAARRDTHAQDIELQKLRFANQMEAQQADAAARSRYALDELTAGDKLARERSAYDQSLMIANAGPLAQAQADAANKASPFASMAGKPAAELKKFMPWLTDQQAGVLESFGAPPTLIANLWAQHAASQGAYDEAMARTRGVTAGQLADKKVQAGRLMNQFSHWAELISGSDPEALKQSLGVIASNQDLQAFKNWMAGGGKTPEVARTVKQFLRTLKIEMTKYKADSQMSEKDREALEQMITLAETSETAPEFQTAVRNVQYWFGENGGLEPGEYKPFTIVPEAVTGEDLGASAEIVNGKIKFGGRDYSVQDFLNSAPGMSQDNKKALLRQLLEGVTQ